MSIKLLFDVFFFFSLILAIYYDLLAAWSDGNVWVNMLEQAGQHGAKSAPVGQIIFYFFIVKKHK